MNQAHKYDAETYKKHALKKTSALFAHALTSAGMHI
jgi:hypothetical protein